MSRRRKKPAASGSDGQEPAVQAVAVRRRGPGHELVYMELPESVVEQYATNRDAPEIRGIVAGKLLAWVEEQP